MKFEIFKRFSKDQKKIVSIYKYINKMKKKTFPEINISNKMS